MLTASMDIDPPLAPICASTSASPRQTRRGGLRSFRFQIGDGPQITHLVAAKIAPLGSTTLAGMRAIGGTLYQQLPAPAPAMVSQRLLPGGRIRSRKSSHSVFFSPGFTENVKSNMLRMGQSGSFT